VETCRAGNVITDGTADNATTHCAHDERAKPATGRQRRAPWAAENILAIHQTPQAAHFNACCPGLGCSAVFRFSGLPSEACLLLAIKWQRSMTSTTRLLRRAWCEVCYHVCRRVPPLQLPVPAALFPLHLLCHICNCSRYCRPRSSLHLRKARGSKTASQERTTWTSPVVLAQRTLATVTLREYKRVLHYFCVAVLHVA
jgi:hypothetical protein